MVVFDGDRRGQCAPWPAVVLQRRGWAGCGAAGTRRIAVRPRRARAGCGAPPRRSALRADCPAMLGRVAASLNSLRSLRSPRSDSGDESVDDARCARCHAPCASRRLKGAPQPARVHLWSIMNGVRSEAPRPARARLCCAIDGVRTEANPRWTSRQALSAGRDFCGDEKRRAGVGARPRASKSCLPQLFERSERSERREFCVTTPARASQCSRPARPTATA